MERRTFIHGLGAAITLGPAALKSTALAQAPAAVHPDLTKINKNNLLKPDVAKAWHVVKDSKGGPTLAGSPSWKNFLELCEKELRDRGVVDIFKNAWTYKRWWTTDYPDDSGWSLVIDGQKVKVPSYSANCGNTPPEGVTADLVVYKRGAPIESYKGKIVVIPPNLAAEEPAAPAAEQGEGAARGGRGTGGGRGATRATGDYEYLSSADTFPNPLSPRSVGGAASPFGKMGVGSYTRSLQEAGAVGLLFTIPISFEAAAGTYTFGVPALYNLPTLFLDKDSGAQVLAAANSGKKGTLRVVGQTEDAETYQLFGYLPGKNYKTPEDEHVLLITHTDGPSISQDNGALGIVGMIDYFAKIPQAERPRTLMVFLDCRHYMPGAERAFAAQDYSSKNPDIYKNVVAAMGIEHLGQKEYLDEATKPFHPSGQAELSSVWITNNQKLVDMAIKSVKDNGLKRVQVQSPGRPGLHGGEQGPWYGLGGIARRLRVPGASTMGSMTAYWSTKARLDYFDVDHFVNQVATMSQICGDLMCADMKQLQSPTA